MNKYQDALNNLKKVTCNCKLTDLIIATLQELVDKATPMRPIKKLDDDFDYEFDDSYTHHYCPNCENEVEDTYCPHCGQKLDWSEEND